MSPPIRSYAERLKRQQELIAECVKVNDEAEQRRIAGLGFLHLCEQGNTLWREVELSHAALKAAREAEKSA